MFLFWISRTKRVSRTPCCLCNISCHAKPLVLLFVILQLSLLVVVILHLRGVVDLLSAWDMYSSIPPPLKFKNYVVVNKNEVFQLHDTDVNHFRTRGQLSCLIAGTKSLGLSQCNCHSHWYGDDCGIPEPIWFDSDKFSLVRRDKARRLIYAFQINRSTDFAEIKIQETKEVIDLFIIAERNQSVSGLKFLSQLSRGWLSDYADHLLYVQDTNRELNVDLLTEQVVHHLSDVRPDDFLILSTSEDLPTVPVLTCLKLYDGFPKIFTLHFQHLLYGFFNPFTPPPLHSQSSNSFAVTSINFLLKECKGKGSCLLSKSPTNVIGSPKYPAGWRCIDCVHATTVNHQMINGTTKPRGNMIPNFVLAHPARFRYLLEPKTGKPATKTVKKILRSSSETSMSDVTLAPLPSQLNG